MARGDRNSDDSDSDWDSLALPPPAAADPDGIRINRVYSASGSDQSSPKKIIQDLQSIEERLEKVSSNLINEPLYSRPHSTSRPSSLKGPLTFIDRQLEEQPPVPSRRSPTSYSIDTNKTVPMTEEAPSPPSMEVSSISAGIRPEHPHHQRQHHQQQAGDFDSVTRQQLLAFDRALMMRKPVAAEGHQHHQTLSLSSSEDGSVGFDNVAFSIEDGDCRLKSRANSSHHYSERRDEMSPSPPSAITAPPSAAAAVAATNQFPQPDETIEIFCYDKGNTDFYQVSEKRRRPVADDWNAKLFKSSNRFWAEVTSIIGLPFVFLLAFVLQILRFATVGLLRPLLIGLFNGFSDGLLKPLLTTLFNAVVQPIGTFLHNVVSVIKLVVAPLAEILQILVSEPLAKLFRAFRLVEIHHQPPVLRHV